jgi:hypothetical protein
MPPRSLSFSPGVSGSRTFARPAPLQRTFRERALHLYQSKLPAALSVLQRFSTMQRRILAAVFAALLLGSIAIERAASQSEPKASQNEMKKQFAERASQSSAPTEQHKLLAMFVGDFDQQTEVRMGPGEPMRFHSIAKGEWIMGGRFVKIDSHSASDEELKGDRITVYGYDLQFKKFTLWTIDSMSSTASVGEGDYDAKTKTFTFEGEREGQGATKAKFRWTLKLENGGTIAQEIAMKMPGGESFTPVVTVKHVPKKK